MIRAFENIYTCTVNSNYNTSGSTFNSFPSEKKNNPTG